MPVRPWVPITIRSSGSARPMMRSHGGPLTSCELTRSTPRDSPRGPARRGRARRRRRGPDHEAAGSGMSPPAAIGGRNHAWSSSRSMPGVLRQAARQSGTRAALRRRSRWAPDLARRHRIGRLQPGHVDNIVAAVTATLARWRCDKLQHARDGPRTAANAAEAREMPAIAPARRGPHRRRSVRRVPHRSARRRRRAAGSEGPDHPGHEIVGVVEQVGDSVSGPRVGDRVGVPWLGWTCGDVRVLHERAREPVRARALHRLSLDGGYAECVRRRRALLLPAAGRLQRRRGRAAAVRGAHRLSRVADGRRRPRLGIYGFGAAAHIIAQVARLRRAARCMRSRAG